jgi:putative transcriptional regulator
MAEVSVKSKLRELREAKQWSQSDLADKLGVSRQTVNAIETEKYDPSLRRFPGGPEKTFDMA